MALMYAKYPYSEPLERAVKLVMARQHPVCSGFSYLPLVKIVFFILTLCGTTLQDGSWSQEAIEGVFNKTCAISYPNFKFSFTIWMLGKADAYLRDLGKKRAQNLRATANGILSHSKGIHRLP